MMISLSPPELLVANEYCKGLADKEVAGNLNKSVWTVKTQKRTIYRKLELFAQRVYKIVRFYVHGRDFV